MRSVILSLRSSLWVVAVWLVLALLGVESKQAKRQRQVASGLSEYSLRSGMLEALEDLVQRERFYRLRSGSFTSILGKLEFEVPAVLRNEVEVRVARADREHLVVEAFRENGRERVWMDEQFRVQANFPLRGLNWVVVEKMTPHAVAPLGEGAALPALEIEPVSATAAAGEWSR